MPMREMNRFTFTVKRGEAEAKYWLDEEFFEVIEAHSYNMSPHDKRTVRRIIYEHFDHIVSEWFKFQEKKYG